MSDHYSQQGSNDRRRRNRRRPGGDQPQRSGSNNSGSNRGSSFRPNRAPKQTTLQKILSFLTFGLLGKPTKKSGSGSGSGQRREPTSNVTIVTSKGGDRDRDRGDRGDRDRDRDRDRGERGDRGERSERGERNDRGERVDRPRRQPAPADLDSVVSDRLYIGNLSYDAAESDLFELFNGVGDVRNAEVVVNNRTQRSKGFAFVTMGSTEEARRAVAELHGKDFMGRPLQISGAKPASSRDGNSDSDEESSEEEETPASQSA
jgi:hypothetical protein